MQKVTTIFVLLLWSGVSGRAQIGPLNARSFGAVGNGLTDDTFAIQAALTAAGSEQPLSTTVYVPAGTYKITSTLHVPPGVTLTGDGYNWSAGGNRTMFTSKASTPVLSVSYQQQQEAYVTLTGFSIDCSGTPGSTGLQIGNIVRKTWTSYVNIEKVQVRSCETNILLLNTFHTTLSHIDAEQGSYGIHLNPPDYTTTILISDSSEFHGSTYGIAISGTNTNITIRDSAVEGNKIADLYVDGPINGNLLVDGDYFATNPGSKARAIDLEATATGSVSNSTFADYLDSIYINNSSGALYIFSDNFLYGRGNFVYVAGSCSSTITLANNTADTRGYYQACAPSVLDTSAH